jgi:hypothetical protein
MRNRNVRKTHADMLWTAAPPAHYPLPDTEPKPLAIYRRDAILPEWEPIPWDMKGRAADVQEQGFHARAMKPIPWQQIRPDTFPSNGIFGHSHEWFMSKDVEFVATWEGEDLVLVRNIWSGFPDPPEWGLWSRREGRHDMPWSPWGHVPELPAAWNTPGDGQ